MHEQRKAKFPKGADTVLKMFTDQAYFLKKYEMTGAINIELLNVSHQGDNFSIEVKRDVPADVPLPGFAKKLVSETMSVTQKDSWNTANKTGRLDINIKGAPVELFCEMELVDEGDSSTLVLNFTANANIPLIGKKIERLLLDDVIHKTETDSAAGVELLANY